MSVSVSLDVFDDESIDAAVAKIRGCKVALIQNADRVAWRLATDAYQAAFARAHVDTGDLKSNLRVEPFGRKSGVYRLISDVAATTPGGKWRSESRRKWLEGKHYAIYHEGYLKKTEGSGYMEAASKEALIRLPAYKGMISLD